MLSNDNRGRFEIVLLYAKHFSSVENITKVHQVAMVNDESITECDVTTSECDSCRNMTIVDKHNQIRVYNHVRFYLIMVLLYLYLMDNIISLPTRIEPQWKRLRAVTIIK